MIIFCNTFTNVNGKYTWLIDSYIILWEAAVKSPKSCWRDDNSSAYQLQRNHSTLDALATALVYLYGMERREGNSFQFHHAFKCQLDDFTALAQFCLSGSRIPALSSPENLTGWLSQMLYLLISGSASAFEANIILFPLWFKLYVTLTLFHL